MSLHSQTSLRTWTLGAHSMGRSPRRSRSRVTELLRPQSQARRPGLPSTSGRSSQKHQKQRNNSAQSRPRHFVDQPDRMPPHRPHPRSAPTLRPPQHPSAGKRPTQPGRSMERKPQTLHPDQNRHPDPRIPNDYYTEPQTRDTSSTYPSRCLRCRATSGARCYTPVLSWPAFCLISVRSAPKSL